jgi:hypothetical protein
LLRHRGGRYFERPFSLRSLLADILYFCRTVERRTFSISNYNTYSYCLLICTLNVISHVSVLEFKKARGTDRSMKSLHFPSGIRSD